MKIINNSEEFKLQFNGTEYTIPNGEFEVVNEKLVNHILFIANKWEKDVKIVPNSSVEQIKVVDKKEEIKATEEIVEKQVENVDTKPPVFSGATIETLPRKQGRPKKNVE